MPFDPSPRVAPMLTRIRHFLTEEILPLEHTLLQEGFGVLEPILAQKRLRAKELGLWTPHLPEEFGGMGLSLSEFAHISEELGTSPLGHYVCNVNAPDIGNMELLHLFGSPAQHEQWLRPLAEGKIRSCFAMTEPEHAGSNPVLMSTTAVKDGDDYVINGHKWFTTAADGAAFAVTMAITDPDASRYKRASQIIVPTDAPGYVHVRRIRIMGEEGEGFLSHSEVRFENCRVPQTNRLGDEGSGFALAQERLGPGRIHHTMRWLGIARRALDMTCAYAARRELAPASPWPPARPSST